MRRRALLAANMKGGEIDFGELPPESTEFAFPLYLNIIELDYESADHYEYIREGDEISASLCTWFFDNAIYDGNTYEDYWYIDMGETNQIYINGVPVTKIEKYEFETEIALYVSGGVFDEVTIDSDVYSLYGIAYK
jgi:hypothetical protein